MYQEAHCISNPFCHPSSPPHPSLPTVNRVLQFSSMLPHGNHDVTSWSYSSSTMLSPHDLHTYTLCLTHVYFMFYMLIVTTSNNLGNRQQS